MGCADSQRGRLGERVVKGVRVRLSDLVDVAAILAVAGGFGLRFGLWLALVVVGVLVLAANWARST